MFICRVCLTLEDNLYPIIPLYLKSFTDCTGILDIKSNDFLCPSCIAKLNEVQSFRSEALKSNEFLKSNNIHELINAEIKREPVDSSEIYSETEEMNTGVEMLEEEIIEWPYDEDIGVLKINMKPQVFNIQKEIVQEIPKEIEHKIDLHKSLRSIKAKIAWTEETKRFLIKNCPYCFYYSKNKIEMRDHIQEHLTKNGGVECDHCGKKFPSKLRLYEHLHKIFKGGYKRQKRISSGPLTTDNGIMIRKRLFSCDYCNYQFEEKLLLEKHVDHSHPNAESKFLCSVCGKTFSSQKKLTSHLQTHKTPKQNRVN